ncbi:hypothetical protein AAEX28_03180 [Lentisphaerota bacterium WC36G]|nr:hypothetical protein LJT99_06055 [Lentisphaerae bacterium WC36]
MSDETKLQLKEFIEKRDSKFQTEESFKRKFFQKLDLERDFNSKTSVGYKEKTHFKFVKTFLQIAAIVVLCLFVTIIAFFESGQNNETLIIAQKVVSTAHNDEKVLRLSQELFEQSNQQAIMVNHDIRIICGQEQIVSTQKLKYLTITVDDNGTLNKLIIPVVNNNLLQLDEDNSTLKGSFWTYQTEDGFVCLDADIKLSNDKVIKKNLIIKTSKNGGGNFNVKLQV